MGGGVFGPSLSLYHAPGEGGGLGCRWPNWGPLRDEMGLGPEGCPQRGRSDGSRPPTLGLG